MKFKLRTLILFLILHTCIFTTKTTTANDDLATGILPAILPLILNNETPASNNCPGANSGATITIDLVGAAELESLRNVTRIAGNLNIRIGDQPGEINSNSDLSALDSIVEVTGDVVFEIALQNNPDIVLDIINTFNCLKTVGGSLDFSQPEITSDTSVIEFMGFENLESVGTLFIGFHDDLVRIPSFNNLHTIGGDVTGLGLVIVSNPVLQNIPRFESLTSINGIIAFTFLDSIEEITGFENLTQREGDIFITDNPLLDCPANVTTQILPANFTENNLIDCPTSPT